MLFTAEQIDGLPDVISAPRFATYLRARRNDPTSALLLYQWNLRVSAAFMIPLQICEVAVRNGIVEAIEKVHGPNWPWSNGFIRSLPATRRGYDPSDDLRTTAKRMPTSGKVVADLKFAFWQFMFTVGQDERLWKPHFFSSFPGVDPAIPIATARGAAFDALQSIRSVRNRIAHHEPVFARNCRADYDLIRETVRWRSAIAADWMDGVQDVTALMDEKPK